MTAVAGPGRSLVSTFLMSAGVVGVTVATLSICARVAPAASVAKLAVMGGLVATAVVFSINCLVAARDEVGRLVALTGALRRDRSGLYQKGMLLERALGASTTIAVIVDEAGRVVYANPSAQRYFGDSFGAGKRLEGESLPALIAAGPRELQEAATATHDVLFTCARGEVAETETFHLAKHSFEMATHKYTSFLLRPLTKDLARKEVETWKKAIRALSHEVNNSLAPITSLLHSARLMLANPAGFQQRLGAALHTIEERSAHLRAFLDGYASFARLPLPAKRPVPWRTLLAGVEGLYRFQLEGLLPDGPAFADPGQLQQVLINLLKNAAESASAPESITLAVRSASGGVEVVVSDRGKGMSASVMRSALLPFYSTKKTGKGLGLPLCREIIEAHGGRLSLHPRQAGGLAVSCWLPAAA